MTRQALSTTAPRRTLPSLQHLIYAMALLGAGMFLGSTVTLPSIAWGQTSATPPQPHLLSGSQLSLPILQDISDTLKDIDSRLSRMEVLAKQMSKR